MNDSAMNDSAGVETAEVVRVIDEYSLIDSESYQRTYRAGSMRLPGHYIVRWLDRGGVTGAYDEGALWVGPYSARSAAERMIEFESGRLATSPTRTAGVSTTHAPSRQVALLGSAPHRHADAQSDA